MSCRGCGTENRPGRKFCVQCGASLESACPTCGSAIEPGDRFCGECGATLTNSVASSPAAAASAALHVSERRLVSVLFADLVGFTTLSEHRDPEEVRDLLSRYFDRCRALIERYGGTVEKFIGDAVMAVWGTPVAREDDAERAVRAALGLTQAVTTMGQEVGMPELRVRAGVLTGRAAVELGAESEGMVLGDTVNTASRLQSIAAPGTVMVDDVTRRASEAAVAFEDAGLHQVKGREQPVHAWTALRVVAGAGGARRGAGLEALFVGRDRELEVVIESSEASATNARAGLVTVIGEAGFGKSRLLWEFFKYVDGIGATRWWHQGRCLSYGEGVGYWAVAEMVRARAGILEEEEPASARAKLRAVVETHVPDERERRLIEPRLAHLLGLEQRTATEAADLFSGWRLFFERMAQTNPVILAFEDLQWADSGLLDFIDYLLEWSAEFPIFILALGRGEVEARRPDWGMVVRLGPLGSSSMRTLLDSVVPGLPEELISRILERAEGVPLYAVETVRMLLDRRILTQDGQRYIVSGTIADLEVPETLQALVAARLDNLETVERALLQDGAVLGMSFSPSAVAAVSGRSEDEVRSTLDALVTKQVLGRIEDTRLAERGQYHFLQGLLRTIALGTLTRRDRKARHLAAAEHLRAVWGDATEIAEVLASHYLDAVEADPDAVDADAIRASARETLAAAGHRAVSLALGVEARRYFEQAAALADEDVERARLLAEAGVAAARAADRVAAHKLLGDAIAVLDDGGRDEDAARTRALLANVLIDENRLEEAGELIDRARQVLSGDEMMAELAARRARVAFLTGDNQRALQEAEVALSIADPRGLRPLFAEAAITRANALQYGGRLLEAMSLQALGLQVALEADVTDQALRGYFNLAEFHLVTGHPEESGTLLERGLALARERGNRSWEQDLVAQRVGVHAFCGEWDAALALSETVRPPGETGILRLAAVFAPLILAARGDANGLEIWLAQPVDSSEWHELALIEKIARAVALRAAGQLDEAARLIVAAAPEQSILGGLTHVYYIGEVFDALIDAEQLSLVEELLASAAHDELLVTRAALQRARGVLLARHGEFAEAETRLAQAATTLRDAGNPFELARTLLDDGRVLIELGRSGEATAVLQKASSVFARLGATPWLERTKLLLDPVAVPAD
jgi:class 3 adenylate cyclase/tetratricopeptide (TPR) repeat protein